jgi:hypothetical protein
VKKLYEIYEDLRLAIVNKDLRIARKIEKLLVAKHKIIFKKLLGSL